MVARLYKLYNRNLAVPFLSESRKSYRREISSAPVYELFTGGIESQQELKEKQQSVPIITCRTPALNCYVGDRQPNPKQLKLISSEWRRKNTKRDYFYIHPYLSTLTQDAEYGREAVSSSFLDFRLNPDLVSKLREDGIEKPTTIQEIGIPEILAGRNTLLAAETGCGKTLTYLLPILQHISKWKEIENYERKSNSPYAIIVTPTKELSQQIGIEAKRLANVVGVSTKTITFRNLRQLMANVPVNDVDILVGSIGSIQRLIGLGIYKTNFLRHVVLDEAGALFHDSFSRTLGNILQKIKFKRADEIEGQIPEDELPSMAQLTLVSATMPTELDSTLGTFINMDTLRVLTTSNLHHVQVLQRFIRLTIPEKPEELLKCLKRKSARKEQTIVFSNSNRTCDWVSMFLEESCIDVVHINGQMPLAQRRRVYTQFQNGNVKVLSTTDAGSRGLDTTRVNYVVNYDFPLNTADYINRCGRTNRLGGPKNCEVTNFVTKNDISLVNAIEKAARLMKPISPWIGLPKAKSSIDQEENESDSYDAFEEAYAQD